jgi:hypothetical protein
MCTTGLSLISLVQSASGFANNRDLNTFRIAQLRRE